MHPVILNRQSYCLIGSGQSKRSTDDVLTNFHYQDIFHLVVFNEMKFLKMRLDCQTSI